MQNPNTTVTVTVDGVAVEVPQMYYDEVVHQDGEEYFAMFATAAELVEDIALYMDHAGEG